MEIAEKKKRWEDEQVILLDILMEAQRKGDETKNMSKLEKLSLLKAEKKKHYQAKPLSSKVPNVVFVKEELVEHLHP